ncbi:hypothetical protein CE91St19_27090 [Odoribacter laneus]|nr:hypothetical protein CE91St19_27090 [Odoribacter laneus]GKI25407.1 hypothetical protein CE91St20_15440 [Odoribacter laneus]
MILREERIYFSYEKMDILFVAYIPDFFTCSGKRSNGFNRNKFGEYENKIV